MKRVPQQRIDTHREELLVKESVLATDWLSRFVVADVQERLAVYFNAIYSV